MIRKTSRLFRIKGYVINRETGEGVPGCHVEAWDKDLLFDDFVAETGEDKPTDELGYFELAFQDDGRFNELFFDRFPDLFFKVKLAGKCIADTRNYFVLKNFGLRSAITDEPGEIVANVTLKVDHSGTAASPFIVKGVIRHQDGTPATGIKVCAYDKDLRSEQLLGEQITNQAGEYQIEYTAESFSRVEKNSADLMFKIYDDAGEELTDFDLEDADGNKIESVEVRDAQGEKKLVHPVQCAK